MQDYDKDVVARRFRKRRMARKSETAGKGGDRLINLFFLLFALGAVILLAVLAIAFFS